MKNLGAWAANYKDQKNPAIGTRPAEGVLPNVKIGELDWLDDNGKAQLQAFGNARPPVVGNPPSWVKDEGAWEKAKESVKKRWDSYDEPWAVVAYVYKRMTGEG